ncbi:MAG: hypothetical protein M1426_04340 [Patescibacteria group bacterium]|nr:hypothetical protein [Patescibacteria group bacterium]
MKKSDRVTKVQRHKGKRVESLELGAILFIDLNQMVKLVGARFPCPVPQGQLKIARQFIAMFWYNLSKSVP